MNRIFIFFLFSIFLFSGCIKIIDLSNSGSNNDNGNKPDDEDVTPISLEFKSFKIFSSLNTEIDQDIVFDVFQDHITAYLRSSYDLGHIIVNFETVDPEVQVYVDGVYQQSGVTINDFTQHITYDVLSSKGLRKSYNITIVPYSGLPIITINTVGESAVTNKEIWMPGLMKIDGMGQFENSVDSVYVRGRGNGSWKFPKKPFNVKKYNKTSLLDMPRHKRWSFLANYRDRTLLRNDFTFKIGGLADGLEWTPSGQFTDVVFNGKYMGNFYVCEQIRVDENRVNIKEINKKDTLGVNITGGYLLEFDSYYDEVNRFRTNINNWPVNIKSPDEDVCQEVHVNYIRDYINTVEQMLHSGQFDVLYRDYIDINSFVDYYLVQTLSGNTELLNIYSVYCYKKRDGKLYAGPLWDFDLSTYSKPSGTAHNTSVWYKYLMKDPVFIQLAKQRFVLLKSQLTSLYMSYIYSQSQYLYHSSDMNWNLWEIDTSLMYGRLNGDETLSYDAAIQRMVDIFESRISWLEQYLNGL